MARKNNKDKDDTIHATVITSQKLIDVIGKDLNVFFSTHEVSLVSISPITTFGPDAIAITLEGKQQNIEKSVSQLKVFFYQKENGLEVNPIKSLPPRIKGYLQDMEDDSKFEKLFKFCSKDYLDFCKSNKIKPHPEVEESILK